MSMSMIIFSFIRKRFQKKEVPNYNEINAKSAMHICAVQNKKVLVIGCNTGYDCSFLLMPVLLKFMVWMLLRQ